MRGRRRMLVRIVTAARDPNFGGFFTCWALVLLRQGWGAYVTLARLVQGSSSANQVASSMDDMRLLFQCTLRVAGSACSLFRTRVCGSCRASSNVAVAHNSFVELSNERACWAGEQYTKMKNSCAYVSARMLVATGASTQLCIPAGFNDMAC